MHYGFSPLLRCMAIAVAFVASLGSSAHLHAQTTYEAGDLFLGGSRVYTHVYKKGLGHEHAVIGLLKSGYISLDGRPRSSGLAGELVFDMQSFLADTDTARKYIGLEGTTDPDTQKQVNANMLGADVLDVKTHPTAVFRAKEVVALQKTDVKGQQQYQISGDFTLHGITKPIQFIATTQPTGDWVRLKGTFSILQTDYGIKPYTKAFGAVGVADKLDITGDVLVAPQSMTVR